MDNDPEFLALQERYVKSLPEKVSRIEKALSEGDREVLQKDAHKLAGSSDLYGFSLLSKLAAELVQACKSGAEIDQEVQALVECAKGISAEAKE